MGAFKYITTDQLSWLSGGQFRSVALLICGVFITLAVACAPVGPDYQPPQPELPFAWSVTGTQSTRQMNTEALEHWWTQFNDPLLDSLIKTASAANHDIKIAAARIRQARAQYRLTTATVAPTLDVSGTYSNARRSANLTGSNSGTTEDLFQAGFDVSWEIDIFGGARRAAEAAEALLASAGEDSRDVLISLEAEVARNYLELRANQQRLAITEETIAVQEKNFDLTRGRWQSGFGNQLEVTQAETQLALTRTQLPLLKNSIGQAEYRLSLLLGLPPGALSKKLAAAPFPTLPHLLPATLPSDLLRRRPDIRRAERQLAAANAEIGVAIAELFPRFSLTALLGLQSNHLSDFIRTGSRYWTVGPTVSWSLFEAGRTRANIDLNRGERDEAQLVYEKTVLTALNEVEGSLLAFQQEAEAHLALNAAVISGQRAMEIATGRYRAGLSDFLEVLQTQATFYQSRDRLAQSQQRLAVDLVALYKALGGGWETATAGPEASDKTTAQAEATMSGGDLKK